jgi:hypothetical protein
VTDNWQQSDFGWQPIKKFLNKNTNTLFRKLWKCCSTQYQLCLFYHFAYKFLPYNIGCTVPNMLYIGSVCLCACSYCVVCGVRIQFETMNDNHNCFPFRLIVLNLHKTYEYTECIKPTTEQQIHTHTQLKHGILAISICRNTNPTCTML